MKPISLLLAFCMLLASSPATYAAPSEDDLKKVVSLSKKAAIKYDKGEYKSALSLYRQARALWKNPKLTFAIVKCLEALKQYEEAKTFAKLGLQENPKPVMKSRLESKLTFLRKKLKTGQINFLISPSGSTVKVNGKVIGTTPLDPISLPKGRVNLEISKKGYATIKQEVTIFGGKKQRIKLSLQALAGTLSVTSIPSKAEVTLDGKLIGTTPLRELSIPLGSHTIAVTAKGYKSATKRITISSQTHNKQAFTLVKGSKLPLPTSTPKARSQWYQSWAGWVVLALGVGAGTTGAIMRVQSEGTYQKVRTAASNPTTVTSSQQDLDNQWSQAQLNEQIGYGVIGGGAALILTSVVLFATHSGPTPKAKTKTTRLLPTPKSTHTPLVQLHQ
jgi:hypothetical protein